VLVAAALIAGVSLVTFGVLLKGLLDAITADLDRYTATELREQGRRRARDDIAVLVVQVGLATAANPAAPASTVGRTPAGESSTRGQC
jgi:hypothetical protein